MSTLSQKEERNLQIMKIIVIATAILNVIIGIISILIGENIFFGALSLFCIASFTYLVFQGIPMIGWKNAIIVIFIGMACSLFFESMGCNFGLFFSKYTYTSYIPGPKLLGFDVYSMVGYGIVCYITWAMAQSVASSFDGIFRKGDIVLIPIIAALLTVSIDLATDPMMASINNAYVWEERAVYYGIPFQNYLGWYIMAYVMYQIMGIFFYYQKKHGNMPPVPTVAKKKKHWVLPAIIYGELFIQLPFYVAIPGNRLITVGSGTGLYTGDIYRGVMVVYAAAVLVPVIIAIMHVMRSKELE